MTRTIILLSLVMAGCGGEKPLVDDSFDELAGLDEKSDAFSRRWRIVGSLEYGETSAPVKYANPPRYRAFKFAGSAGDRIVVDVASKDGDTVAWVLDNDFRTLAGNDDARRGTTDSHIEVTLRSNRSNTHYIVVREYFLDPMTFTVKLEGPKKAIDFYSCQVDRDCVRVEKGCCKLGNYTAIRADRTKEWAAQLGCLPHQPCPAIAVKEDYSVAECLQNRCVLVPVDQIQCGGFSRNPHACPGGYVCEGKQLAADLPGSCTQQCGGIAGLACRKPGQFCVDIPNDQCDPRAGGVDCLGVCRDAICDGRTARCAAGYYWDQYECNCVERKTCGGIANLPCAAGKTCIDDPSDNCDPRHGGADCGGICVAQNDCRNTGCGAGRYCAFCWASYQCIPEGAVC